MKPLQTVDIVDPKGSGEKRVINAGDFDPDQHTRWEDRDAGRSNRRRSSKPAGDDG